MKFLQANPTASRRWTARQFLQLQRAMSEAFIYRLNKQTNERLRCAQWSVSVRDVYSRGKNTERFSECSEDRQWGCQGNVPRRTVPGVNVQQQLEMPGHRRWHGGDDGQSMTTMRLIVDNTCRQLEFIGKTGGCQSTETSLCKEW